MDFTFSSEQELVRDTFARFSDEQIAPQAAALDEAHQFPMELFRKLGELGFFAMRYPEELDGVELSFEGLTEAGGLLGHGGFVCYGEDFSPCEEVIHWMSFFANESCVKCTPCRIGTQRALEILHRIGTGDERDGDRDLLGDLDEVMTSTSLCALGGLAMNPVRSTMQKWSDAFAPDSS